VVAFIAKYGTALMRNYKVQREIQNVLKRYMAVYNQKLNIATQVFIKRLFKKQPLASISSSISYEPPTSADRSEQIPARSFTPSSASPE
jgi:hypothetical protein